MLKLVEKGTKWERLQARKAKAQERLAVRLAGGASDG